MFICTGNICRSAMAHKIMEKKAKEKAKNIEVYSCGIFAEDGDRPTYNAIEVMKRMDIDLSDHKATNIRNSNIKQMDIILCATQSHKNTVVQLYPELKEKTYTIKEYAGYNKEDWDISDPWGYDIEVYQFCAEQLEKCLEKVIDKIE